MPPNPSCADHVYTTSVVAFPEIKHIEADENGHKDFTALIDHAVKLGGFTEDKQFAGINSGATVTTGFGWKTVLDNTLAIIDAVKAEQSSISSLSAAVMVQRPAVDTGAFLV